MTDKKNLDYENKHYQLGANNIAGVDEVGRGCIFGPVVAVAIILKKDYYNAKITDSKCLSKKAREQLYPEILSNCLTYGVGVVSNKVIDEINILNASKLAMIKAINQLSIKPDVVLIDAVKLDINYVQENIIKGDLLSFTISCASIVAKVIRDHILDCFSKKYYQYGLDVNKGYPTKKHLEALSKYGSCIYHRFSYSCLKNYQVPCIK